VLNLGKNCDVKWLEFMGALRRESQYENVMLVYNCSELIGFMRIMLIEEEENGCIACLIGGSTWDKGFLKPLEAEFVVSPSVR
jgi:hypothetical protein